MRELPPEALREILDFALFLRLKKTKDYRTKLVDHLKEELSDLDSASLSHLEEEFRDYKNRFPRER